MGEGASEVHFEDKHSLMMHGWVDLAGIRVGWALSNLAFR